MKRLTHYERIRVNIDTHQFDLLFMSLLWCLAYELLTYQFINTFCIGFKIAVTTKIGEQQQQQKSPTSTKKTYHFTPVGIDIIEKFAMILINSSLAKLESFWEKQFVELMFSWWWENHGVKWFNFCVLLSKHFVRYIKNPFKVKRLSQYQGRFVIFIQRRSSEQVAVFLWNFTR